eukprot:TRINITY_DN54006_c0_g1_i1.p1 TRINITY_DN54006_c0_g1~~TRINITY_DN54006_c0_g1_i1.p1  ORF type:complete len:170 (-),score=24.88 TRINITY_DN54006_c0_g1_i1:306-815(-)
MCEIVTNSDYLSNLSDEQKKKVADGRAVWAGGVGSIVEQPDGAAAKMLSGAEGNFADMKVMNFGPPEEVLGNLLRARGAMAVFKEFSDDIEAAPKSYLGYFATEEVFKVGTAFSDRFKSHDVGLHCCRRIVGGKGSREFLWFVFVDLTILSDYTPQHAWDGSTSACAMS